MKIIKQDMKQEEKRLLIENSDDLWYLSHVVEPDDIVRASTERKIKIGKEGERNIKVVRKKVTLTIKVEKVEFQEYGSNLRILGTIVDGPDDVPRGDHHTVAIEPGSQLSIRKEAWLPYHTEQLKDAGRQGSRLLIVLFDREEAEFYLLEKKGITKLSALKGNPQKKDYEQTDKKDFWQDIGRQLEEYDKKYACESIILGSPAFWKDYVMKILPDGLKKKTIGTSCSDMGQTGIREILKRPELRAALERDKTAKEESLVEDTLMALQNEKVAYGLKDVEVAVEQGNAKIILVTTSHIQKSRQEDAYARLDSILKTGAKNQAEIHLLALVTKKIDGLGGIVAIKRWT